MRPATPFDCRAGQLPLACHALKSCAPCDCSDAEIAMRHYASPRHALPPMSEAQRQWCIVEIRRQPASAQPDPTALPDDALARQVLKAWSRAVRF